jgi:(p)ppGpp synthase/HD superfamily hydrolase
MVTTAGLRDGFREPRANKDIRRYHQLDESEKPLDQLPLTATLATLSRLGYSLARQSAGPALDDAIALAVHAHRGQRDKVNEPYLMHVFRVMLSQQDEMARIVAVLHDVLEDAPVTLADLQALGYGEEICAAIDCLTRRKGEPYEEMISRVIANPLARRVKLADLEDNMDPSRLVAGDKDAKRQIKYRAARERLKNGE